MRATAIIADDEPNLQEHLKRLLAQLWPDLKIVAVADRGDTASSAIIEWQPDIVFLDIQMPGLTGLEVASIVPEKTRVVFVTAFSEHAVSAFEQAAVDYILKPVSRNRLRTTVERLQATLATRQETTGIAPADAAADAKQLQQLLDTVKTTGDTQYLQWLRTGQDEVTRLIAVDEIVYFEADNKYTTGYTADAEYLFRQSISALETQLDPQKFWRIHRGTIVRVSAIERANRDLRGRYVLTIKGRKEKIRASQRYGHLFRLS